VVASLWRVPDRGTAELMRRFYEGMLVKGMPPAAALRAAQLALRKDPRWAAPYNWAGFTLQGEWN
jgi:CHAT domain-containing protein